MFSIKMAAHKAAIFCNTNSNEDTISCVFILIKLNNCLPESILQLLRAVA